jgi:probable rRNA maturation factor
VSKTFSIINETTSELPKLPFQAIKEASLGKKYSLNLIITTSKQIEKLNTIYRDKEYPTDILSFPISDNEGEIYISLAETKKEAVKFERTFENFLAFLFIHGCVHLKGYDHSSTMEDIEVDLRKQFKV